MSTRLFVLCLSVAAILTLVKYVIQVEGTKREKLAFFLKTGKQALIGIQKKYAGSHRFNKRLPVMYGSSLA